MKFLLTLGFAFISISAFSQFGLRVSYNLNHAPKWDEFFQLGNDPTTKALDNSLTFTLDYWLRLPNHRIEFYPNISYHHTSKVLPGFSTSNPPNEIVEASLRQIGAGVLAHIYVLDLAGDCECPTFSKQGGFFKKGFFLVAGTGTDYSQKAINGVYRDGNLDFKASLGAGIDLGVNDLITISPFLQYQYFPSISWHEIGTHFGIADFDVETSLGQLQFGIRLGFRPDYKRR